MRYLLFFFVTAFSIQSSLANEVEPKEAFDRSLGRLNSIASLNAYIDSCAASREVPAKSRKEVFLVNEIIERKFYHGYSHYTSEDNFLAYLAGKFVWNHLSAIVLPEDLVKHEMAACSQQAIVMMEVLKQRGFNVRKLGLTGHYVLEVFYNDNWHMFDPNHEPKHQGIAHDSLDVLLESGFINESYSRTLEPERVKEVFTNIREGEINTEPAQNARLFHIFTKFISDNILLLVTGNAFLLFLFVKRRKEQKKFEELARLQRRRVLNGDPASLSRKIPLAN
jgi:hypothetical protein